MSSKSIKLSQACEGMIRYKQAAGKSDGTINEYRVIFKKLLLFSKLKSDCEEKPKRGLLFRSGSPLSFVNSYRKYPGGIEMITPLAQNWWTLVVRGVAAIIFGILAYVWPDITFTVLVLFF